MHTTESRKKIRQLKTEARASKKMARIARKAAPIFDGAETEAQTLERNAQHNLALAQCLKDQARLEDLSLWVMEKQHSGKKSSKIYQYWIASWREGDKVHNEHVGSCKKISAEEAYSKARKLKARALGIHNSDS